ncbi:FecCD family ABC transporter permease [Agromyces sp. NPDC056965]|uniref:FecCD family ABC transporter permease n=1 Tax=Agromyces sp. NPDC056965 TaxID=3345983 RepID=UPI003636D50A
MSTARTRPAAALEPGPRELFGRRTIAYRSPGGRVSFRLDVRTLLVGGVLAVASLVLFVTALIVGDFPLTLAQLVGALTGSSDATATMVVLDWRLPRAILGALLGVALGASGAIFQSLTRNPLGSPDILGFASGAYTGALVVIMFASGSYAMIAGGAMLGGILTTAAVYLLAHKRGVQGFRLIVVGIAVSAMLGSVNTWLSITTELDTAMRAAVWGAGSLNGVGWAQTGVVVTVLAILIPGLILTAASLSTLELGDDAAIALGVRAERSRLWLLLIGTALTALVTAAAGPIAFVALAAPQLARRLTASGSVGIGASALLGAVLLQASDLVASRMFAPTQLPVGVVTVSIGGGYLIWLLIRESRRS